MGWVESEIELWLAHRIEQSRKPKGESPLRKILLINRSPVR